MQHCCEIQLGQTEASALYTYQFSSLWTIGKSITGSDGLKDAICHFSTHPPPTAQTNNARDLKFGMEGHRGNTFWVIRAIFEFLPLSRDIGV